jgi:hypothetical protein
MGGFVTGGFAGFQTGGRASGGRGGSPPDGGMLPKADCPDLEPNCQPCGPYPYDCGLKYCDTFRNYCAPYCGRGFDGEEVGCSGPELRVCDADRFVCAECTIDTHCGTDKCHFGKCEAPECSTDNDCENPEPICFQGFCGRCNKDTQCGMDKHCEYGSCVLDMMKRP